MRVLIVSEKAFEISHVRSSLEELPYRSHESNHTLTIVEADIGEAALREVDNDAAKNLFFEVILISQFTKKGMGGIKTATVLMKKKLPPTIMLIMESEEIAKEEKQALKKLGIEFIKMPYSNHDLQICLTKVVDFYVKRLKRNRDAALQQHWERGQTADIAEFRTKLNTSAINELQNIKKLAPWSKLPYITIAEYMVEEEDFKGPIPILRSAIFIDFADQRAHLLLKTCYQKAGLHKEENEELRKLVNSNPESSEANAKYGEALLRERNYVKAIEFFKKAIQKHKPTDPSRIKAKSHWGLGSSLLGIEDSKENQKKASDEFNKAINVDPTLVLAYFNLISVYKKLGMTAEANEVMKKAVKITPSNAKDWLDLFLFYIDDDDTGKAKFSLGKALSMAPDDPRIPFIAGETYLHKKMLEDAIVMLLKASEINPSDIKTYNLTGICYRLLNEPKLSIDYYLKALEIDPEDSNVNYNLGKAYHSMKNVKKAKEAFEKALKINPEMKEAQEAIKLLETA